MARQRKAAILVAVLLIVISAAFITLKMAGLEARPAIPASLDHKPSPETIQDLVEEIASSEKRAALRGPGTMIWKPGETGSFALGIVNRKSTRQNFFLSVSLEGASVSPEPDTSGWILYPSRIVMQPLGLEVVEIAALPTEPGTYLFRVLVCETPECSGLESTGLYYSTTFSFSTVR